MALSQIVDLLVCPRCRQPVGLAGGGRQLVCSQAHAFDVGRQGYVNLLAAAPPKNADTSAMVAARDRFLSGGSYAPIANLLSELVADGTSAPGTERTRVLEVGAGTGYYLAQVLDGLPVARGVALDVSVPAARRAARAHPRIGSVVADGWQQLPVADRVVDVLLNVFAPRNAAEFSRVLADGGVLVTVTPEPLHLAEIRTTLGLLEIQPAKRDQLRSTLHAFRESSSDVLTYPVSLTPESLHDLVAMGPNAFHRTESAIADLVASVGPSLTATVSVRLTGWAPAT